MCLERTDRNGKTELQGESARSTCNECGKLRVTLDDTRSKLHEAQVELLLRSDRINSLQIMVKELFDKVKEQSQKLAGYEQTNP